MKKIILCLILLVVTNYVNAQERSTAIKPLSFYFAAGIGNKSHLGNLGVTTNFFFTRFMSAKFSFGTSIFNKGGGTISIGPEFSFLNSKTGFFRLGAMWCYTGEGFDIYGDDDSIDHVFYNTSYMKNLRFHLGYSFRLESVDITFEGGYSHNLNNYSYYFTGPGTPTQHEHDKVMRGLRSGWMASIYIGSFITKKKKNTANGE